MRRSLLASALLIALCRIALGNTGVFFGSGHSLQLIKTADVQMVAEDVLITPNCGFSAIKQWADFRCRFLLKNRSNKTVKIQVGFPLDRELVGPPPHPAEDTEKVLDYHFIRARCKRHLSRPIHGRRPRGQVSPHLSVGHGVCSQRTKDGPCQLHSAAVVRGQLNEQRLAETPI